MWSGLTVELGSGIGSSNDAFALPGQAASLPQNR
jgi:hypothetical protein